MLALPKIVFNTDDFVRAHLSTQLDEHGRETTSLTLVTAALHDNLAVSVVPSNEAENVDAYLSRLHANGTYLDFDGDEHELHRMEATYVKGGLTYIVLVAYVIIAEEHLIKVILERAFPHLKETQTDEGETVYVIESLISSARDGYDLDFDTAVENYNAKI